MTDIIERIRTFSEYAACEEAADTIETLRARVAELEYTLKVRDKQLEVERETFAACEKDAARYRWLREQGDNHSGYAICTWEDGEGDWFRMVHELDAAIDKAMEDKS